MHQHGIPADDPTWHRAFTTWRDSTKHKARSPLELDTGLQELSKIIGMPHFRTKRGKAFEFEQIQDAICYVGKRAKKPILTAGI